MIQSNIINNNFFFLVIFIFLNSSFFNYLDASRGNTPQKGSGHAKRVILMRQPKCQKHVKVLTIAHTRMCDILKNKKIF